MKKPPYLYILLFIILSFSCGNDNKDKSRSLSDSAEQVEKSSLKETVQLTFERASENQDSIKVKLKYSSTLDSLKLSDGDERYTFLYLTFKDISVELLEKSVKEDVWTEINKEDVKVLELDGEDSAVFYYNASLEKNNRIIGVIDDIVFLKEYNERGETRMIHRVTKFEEDMFHDFN